MFLVFVSSTFLDVVVLAKGLDSCLEPCRLLVLIGDQYCGPES